MLYSEATKSQQSILRERFGVRPFFIQAIKMERIFADKILAAEFYYQREKLFDTAKHIYDLVTMLEQRRIQVLLSEPAELIAMLAYKRKEEEARIGSDLSNKPFSEFTLFQAVHDDSKLERAFMEMQNIYVFSKTDILQPEIMRERIDVLAQNLLSLNEGLEMKSGPTMIQFV